MSYETHFYIGFMLIYQKLNEKPRGGLLPLEVRIHYQTYGYACAANVHQTQTLNDYHTFNKIIKP